MTFERLVHLTARPRARSVESHDIEAVLRIGGRLWRDSSAPCLERSVCVHRQLGLSGAEPQLVLGLASDHRGHAWVELDGRALLEPSDPQRRFQELMRFDSAGTLLTATDVRQTGTG